MVVQMPFPQQTSTEASFTWLYEPTPSIQIPARLNRREMKAQQWEFHFNHVESRLRQVNLPERFDLNEVLEHLKKNDRRKENRAAKDALMKEELEQAITWDRLHRKGSNRLVREGVEALTAHIKAIRNRTDLLLEERRNKVSAFLYCSIEGDLPVAFSRAYVNSYIWERVGWDVIDAEVFEPALDAIDGTRSRRVIDNQVRLIQREGKVLHQDQDLVLSNREILWMTLDIWHSEDVKSIYRFKPWFQENLKGSGWKKTLKNLEKSTRSLKTRILSSYDNPTDLIAPDAFQTPFAHDMFRATLDFEISA